ncbi:hypothetical protein NC651_031477 [Populus alba x Populus x berolinensis]|nr:hypothetical protein NC651_031477 [Populus alba x Populus x berolinensis]
MYPLLPFSSPFSSLLTTTTTTPPPPRSAHLHKTTMYQPNRFKDFPRMSSISSNARPIHSGGSSLASVAPLEAILFDIDGTLCDSDPLHFYAFRDMLQEVSHFPSFDYNILNYVFCKRKFSRMT